MRKRLYLANPYGFSAQQRSGALAALVEALEAAGAEVWEPFARNDPLGRIPDFPEQCVGKDGL